MRARSVALSVACGVLFASTASTVVSARAADDGRAFVAEAVHHDRSRPLRELHAASTSAARSHGALPLRRDAGGSPVTPDGALQRAAKVPNPATLQAGSVNIDGVGDGFIGPAGTFTVNSAPPDTIGAVGPNHYVQVVNTGLAIFNKSGTAIYGPVDTNTLWSGFGGGCQSNNDGDGGVEYDRSVDRWIIHQFSVSTTPYLECVAVSQTGDPTGAYYRYAFSYGTNFPDYPKLGVWSDAYYFTFNMFNSSGTAYLGAKACAYDKSRMLSGLSATQQCFDTSTADGSLLAANLEGATAPPAGEPETLVALGAAANTLAVWKFHVDFATPANTTFTGPTALAVAAFTSACGGGACIPQSGTTNKLDSLADRVMNRLVYRNFGDHEALVVDHSVVAGSSAGMRWYELRLGVGGAVSVYQQGTYAPDSAYRWMGSIALDGAGDIAMGYSQSSSALHPSIRYVGRAAGDALGSMTSSETVMVTGGGSQTGGLNRWGDYSQITVDPVDDCTFWYTNEYIPSTGSFNWRTRIGTFKFSGCPLAANDFSLQASPSTVAANQGSSVAPQVVSSITNGVSQSVLLSLSGAPSGVTGSFAPSTINSGASSTLTLTVGGNVPVGSYNLTITGTGTLATHTAPLTLNVTAASTGLIINGGFESGALSPWLKGGTTAVVAGGRSGAFAVRTGSTAAGTTKAANANQTLTLPSGAHTLTIWYRLVCPDVVNHDWASITVRDVTAAHTYTVIPHTCTNDGLWHQVTYDLTALATHKIKVSLINHDDLVAADPTYTTWDDVSIS